MPFIGYPEIENTYRNKFINSFLYHNPSAKEIKYIAQVKYDGSNIQFIFEPYEEMRIGKRKAILARDDNFNGILDILPEYSSSINYIQGYCDDRMKSVNLYGEIIGPKIQNRIYYGDEKRLVFFDIRVDGEILSYVDALYEFPLLVKNYYVDTYNTLYSFEEIFKIDSPEDHEGIVIKPYNRVAYGDRQLRLKSKNPRFEEKMKSKKEKKGKKKEEDPIVTKMKEKFLPYINENRVKSVFSKEGEIEDPHQIGDYIKLVIEDAKSDFEKDVDTTGVERNQMNQVYKAANREIVKILEKYL